MYICSSSGVSSLNPQRTEKGFGPWTMEGYVRCFEKILSATDVSRNLEIPKWALHLPPGNATIQVLDPDGDTTWEFICSIRSSGRRSMTNKWIDFAKKKELKSGDILRFYRSTIGDGYAMELERHSIRIFGVTIYIG